MGARSRDATTHSRRQSGAAVRIQVSQFGRSARNAGQERLTSEGNVNRREFVTGLVALPALVRPASAEVSTINLGKQYGLPFLPQMVMEDRRLIEAHASRLGVNRLGVGL